MKNLWKKKTSNKFWEMKKHLNIALDTFSEEYLRNSSKETNGRLGMVQKLLLGLEEKHQFSSGDQFSNFHSMILAYNHLNGSKISDGSTISALFLMSKYIGWRDRN